MVGNTTRGKVCLITGASDGIGKVTARELAKQEARVVMLCRNRAKAEQAQAEIKALSGNPHVDLIIADLSELTQVREAAQQFKQRYQQLHLLIHNAGVINGERKVTSDGLENTFATNYLAPFLLTELLLDRLRASAPARIVNVSSYGHTQAHIDFDDLQGAQRYSFLKAYTQSKLAQIYYTYELADRLRGTDITVNALHPGLVSSNFNSGITGLAHLIGAVIYRFRGISVEKGAQTTLYAATSSELDGVTGKYFSEGRELPSSPLSYDPTVRRQLWKLSEELIAPLLPESQTMISSLNTASD